MRARRGRAVRSASQPGPCHGDALPVAGRVTLLPRAEPFRPARPGPWCGGGRRRHGPASPHAKRTPKDIDSHNVRTLLDRAAAAGAARGRRCGHCRRRHHRRGHGPHPRGGRRVLALGRRPLRQGHARPDPPAAGDRPRQRGVGAGARRARARPCRAHPDRDPADFDALHHGRSQQARDAADAGRGSPACRWFSGASRVPTSSASSGSRPRRRRRPRPRPARARPAGQAPVRKGLSPEAVAAIREVVEGRPRPAERAVTSAPVDPWNPAESHLIPPNP